MTAIHQVIPVLAPHDAVGGHTRRLRAALLEAGYQSEIFAEILIDPAEPGAHEIADLTRYGDPTDLLIFQASTGSNAGDWLLNQRRPFAVNYHNVTPAHFFEQWSSEAADNMRRGRNQLRAMAARSVAAFAVSEFNARELGELGFRNVSVTPLILDLAEAPPAPDPVTVEYLAHTRQGTHWLFVGRLAPNKCQHDVVAAFAVYRRLHDPGARLTLVGSPAALSYQEAVLALAEDLGVDTAVTAVSGLSDRELAAYYEDADVFVCLSEHEGFCIPVIEAMRHDLPVIAYAAAAVPDTAGDAAVLISDKDPLYVATAAHELLADRELRESLVKAGRARLDLFVPSVTVPHFVAAVEAAVHSLSGGGGG